LANCIEGSLHLGFLFPFFTQFDSEPLDLAVLLYDCLFQDTKHCRLLKRLQIEEIPLSTHSLALGVFLLIFLDLIRLLNELLDAGCLEQMLLLHVGKAYAG